MFEHEIRKQVTEDAAIVNNATIENLNTKFWKYQNQKAFSEAIEEAKKITIQSIFELPQFEAHVRRHELEWRKPRTQFTVLEQEHIDRTYISN